MTPRWVAGQPDFLPEEYYWLVGVTHRGFPDEGYVRNTFGSNISVRADVLGELGGFNEDLGRKGEKHGQGEETELAARLRDDLDGSVYYTPAATVGHKVFEHRTRIPWLAKRAFWQGYSKRRMERHVQQSTDAELEYLGRILGEFIPDRFRRLVKSPSTAQLKQTFAVFLFTALVGCGYLFGIVSESTRHLAD